MSEVNAQVPASSQATEASSLPQALKAVNAATEADELQQLQQSLPLAAQGIGPSVAFSRRPSQGCTGAK